MQASVVGFAELVRILKMLGEELCGGRLVLTLEGGYNYEALASSTGATIDVLCGKNEIVDPMGRTPMLRKPPDIEAILHVIKQTHRLI